MIKNLSLSHKFFNNSLRLILLVILLFLSACSTTVRYTKDGPPSFKVDFTKFHNPVPVALPYSKYGNCTYRVRGRTYHVLRTAHGFDERGIASWYGTKFHNHPTSSGERYSMFKMTAAMRNLPIPSYVQVFNLKNGKNVIVKVNDRGPFEHNRLIDLSYVAAGKLGLIGHGTAVVEVRAIDAATWNEQKFRYSREQPRLIHRGHPHFYLQVSAYTHKASAERMLNHLRRTMRQPSRIDIRRERHHYIYRVQIGPLANVEVSDKIARHLKRSGIHHPKIIIE